MGLTHNWQGLSKRKKSADFGYESLIRVPVEISSDWMVEIHEFAWIGLQLGWIKLGWNCQWHEWHTNGRDGITIGMDGIAINMDGITLAWMGLLLALMGTPVAWMGFGWQAGGMDGVK